MWNRIATLMHKEFLAVWRDYRSRLVLIVPPIVQLFLFAFAATLDVKNVPIGIVNYDNGEQSYELIERFIGSPFFNRIVFLESIDQAPHFLDTQEGVMVMMLDAQFSRNLDSGNSADVLLVLDGRKSNTTQIVANYVASVIDQFNIDFAAKAEIKQQNTTLIIRNWFNPNLLYYWYNIPSLSGILPMLVALIVTALSIARERELGTFDQLLVSPLRPIEILIGKSIPAILIGMAEASFIIFVGTILFDVPFVGSLILLYASMVVFISSIVGVGLFISSLCQTQQQAMLGTFIFMSPAVLLSGFATPIENMPTWLQPVTYIIPLRYYLVIAKGEFLKDLPPHIIWSNTWPMILIALGTLTGSAWFFRHKLE